MHQPLFLENARPRGLVLFIHGFMGSPRQLVYLAEATHKHDYDASVPLLPGHGVSLRQFAAVTKESWLNHVYSELNGYFRSYDNIYIAGHSLGCLLALNAAGKYSERIRGLFLLACPLRLRGFSFYTLQTRLRQVLAPTNHPLKLAYTQGCAVPLTPGLLWHSAKPAAEVKLLQSMTAGILPYVHIPVTAVYSRADELVDIASVELLCNGLPQAPAEQVILQKSLHAWYPPPEQEIIKNALLRFL